MIIKEIETVDKTGENPLQISDLMKKKISKNSFFRFDKDNPTNYSKIINKKQSYNNWYGLYLFPSSVLKSISKKDHGLSYFLSHSNYISLIDLKINNLVSTHQIPGYKNLDQGELNLILEKMKVLIFKVFGLKPSDNWEMIIRKRFSKYQGTKFEKLWYFPYSYERIYDSFNSYNREDLRKITSIYMKCGIDGFVDFGKGIIHPNEPTQMVLFNPKAINKRDIFNLEKSKSINQTVYYTEDNLFGDLKLKDVFFDLEDILGYNHNPNEFLNSLFLSSLTKELINYQKNRDKERLNSHPYLLYLSYLIISRGVFNDVNKKFLKVFSILYRNSRKNIYIWKKISLKLYSYIEKNLPEEKLNYFEDLFQIKRNDENQKSDLFDILIKNSNKQELVKFLYDNPLSSDWIDKTIEIRKKIEKISKGEESIKNKLLNQIGKNLKDNLLILNELKLNYQFIDLLYDFWKNFKDNNFVIKFLDKINFNPKEETDKAVLNTDLKNIYERNKKNIRYIFDKILDPEQKESLKKKLLSIEKNFNSKSIEEISNKQKEEIINNLK